MKELTIGDFKLSGERISGIVPVGGPNLMVYRYTFVPLLDPTPVDAVLLNAVSPDGKNASNGLIGIFPTIFTGEGESDYTMYRIDLDSSGYCFMTDLADTEQNKLELDLGSDIYFNAIYEETV